MEFLMLLVGLAAGAAIGWLVRQLTIAPVDTGLSPEAVQAQQQAADARHEAIVAQVRQEEAEARSEVAARLAAATSSVEELRASLAATHAQHEEYVAQKRRAEAEREQSNAGHTQVLKTLTPVAQQLQAMQRRVEELEQERSRQQGALAEQIRHTQASVAESKQAAESLASALSNNAVRGVWGETQLRNLVETAGLLPRVDFDLQASIEADSGARRPDMVVNLPGSKQMAVDAKVPYTAYMDAMRSGIDPEDRERLLLDHSRSVRRHVDALSSKSYWSGLATSPEFTVAFIPNDQLLSAALDADPSLMEYAFGKGIVLATPTNLWAILKTVAFTWRQEALTENAKEVFDLGRELYNRVCTLADHAEKLRRSLEGTVKSYNRFAGSLESRVLVTARKFNEMDEASVMSPPAQIDETPRALTAGDFDAIADLERPELDLGLETVEAEVVADDSRSA